MPDSKDTPPVGWNVTYRGPKDKRDRSSAVEVQHAKTRETFSLGEKVLTSKRTADRLAGMADHKFTIEPAKPEGAN